MDPRKNPYAPDAGTPPPELAGRDELIERAAIALYRIRAGRAARSLILHGLRGVEKRYLRAMAELGPGPHRSGDIAEQLGKSVTSVAPVRNELIAKGTIYSPAHGDTAFTVPLFDGFMKRIMPKLPR